MCVCNCELFSVHVSETIVIFVVFSENADMMKEDFKQQPCMVDRLYGMQNFILIKYNFFCLLAIITDLYMDRANFKVR